MLNLMIGIISCDQIPFQKENRAFSDTTQAFGNDETEFETQDLILYSELVMLAIRDSDFTKLASYVHPEAGLVFSPYGFIDTLTAPKISISDLPEIWYQKEKLWGFYDGTGDSINLSMQEYYHRFIYDYDYLNTELRAVDSLLGKGNTPSNILDIFPDSHFVEYHYPGSEEYGRMDWKSLRLVYSEYKGKYKLVAVVHDQWTI